MKKCKYLSWWSEKGCFNIVKIFPPSCSPTQCVLLQFFSF